MATYLDELVQKITTKANLKGFDDLDRKQKRAIKSNDLLAKSFRRAFGMFLGVQGIRSVIKTTREIDLLQRSIQGLTGSAQDWEYLRREAYRTGTDLTKAAQAYKNFYSAASMAGFNRGAVQSMFSDVLVAGRGIGANQQQIGAALLALEQMLSKGKVSMEELRRQMGNALPGSFEIAAKSMGVTTQEFNKLLEAGLSSAEFVPKFTKMLKQELGKGFEANIKSLDFALVNLNTAWMEFQANILQGEAGEALAQLVRDVTKILRSQELLKFIRLISKALEFVIRHIRTILLLFGINKIMQYVNSIKKLHLAILATAESTAALGAVTRTLAAGYAMMFSGAGLKSILTGMKMITAGLWAMTAPILRLSAILVSIMSWIMIIQDLLMTLDPKADTITRRFMQGGVSRENLNKNPLKIDTSTASIPALFKEHKYADVLPLTKSFNENLLTPNSNYLSPNNYNGNYYNSSSQGQTNNLTINITAPNSQPETIAQATEDALYGFFTKYNMAFA